MRRWRWRVVCGCEVRRSVIVQIRCEEEEEEGDVWMCGCEVRRRRVMCGCDVRRRRVMCGCEVM